MWAISTRDALTFVAHVGTRDDEVLTANHDNLLSEESLLGDEASKTSHEVVTGVDDDHLLKSVERETNKLL